MPDYQHLVGQPMSSLPTPAMCADVDAVERNIRRMADFFRDRPCKLRPHWKSNKCVEIARRQLAAGGAAGITAAKLAEAEALVAGGINDVLIANQVVGPDKAARLAELNRRATVRVAVDDAGNVAELAAAARAAGVTVGLLVEVDIGMNRCGVAPGAPAAELARVVATTPGVRFDGLQGYEGHLVLKPAGEEKNAATIKAMNVLVATRRAVETAGLPVAIVSGGGTGTYDITGRIDGIDEIQAGSYALMDACYKKIRPEFENAMFVLATVVSVRPASGTDGLAIVDVGVKGIGSEFGPPAVAGLLGCGEKGDSPQAKKGNSPLAVRSSEEHTFIEGLRGAKVGDKVLLIPSHGCTTANLHRRLWAIREGRVEGCWAIEGSGCLE
jgi:D-serine deaminase-like pyridoxal phosphate-dependent protein